MIRKIETYEFENNLKNKKYKYIFGKNQGEGRNDKFEIVFDNGEKVGCLSNDLSTPQVQEWNEKYIVTINNEIYILSKKTSELLKTYTLNISIYEVIPDAELLYVFGEIDILVLNKQLEVVKQIKLDDILTDYKIENGKINYKTSEGETISERVF